MDREREINIIKPEEQSLLIDGKYVLSLLVRLCVLGAVIFGVFTFILVFVLNRHLGVSYFDDIHTLSSLQGRFPIIFLVTGIIQMGIAGAAMFILFLYWGHAVSGPLVRFQKEMNAVAQGEVTGKISFRENDQLQGLARPLNELQKNIQRQKSEFRRLINQAESLIADYKRLKEDVGVDVTLLDRKRTDLRRIYRDMEHLISEEGKVD